MLTVGIDTGLRACGLGIADTTTGRVIHGSQVKSPNQDDTGADAWLAMANAVAARIRKVRMDHDTDPDDPFRTEVALLIVERQYVAHHPNPNQLIGLMCVVGAVLASVPAKKKLSVFPSQWNKSVGKKKSTRGIWAHLTPAERKLLHGADLKSSGHNILDAVGIARWGLKKLGALEDESDGDAAVTGPSLVG